MKGAPWGKSISARCIQCGKVLERRLGTPGPSNIRATSGNVCAQCLKGPDFCEGRKTKDERRIPGEPNAEQVGRILDAVDALGDMPVAGGREPEPGVLNRAGMGHFVVVCPDGEVRHPEYRNVRDAELHARYASDEEWFARRGCSMRDGGPSCSGGVHVVARR
jgi:hypothetical protein